MDKLSGLLRENMDWLMGKGRRKEKDVDTTNKPYLADDLVSKRISNVDLERLVEPPQGLDYNEWLATHTISFFEHLNLLYGSVSDFCNSTMCSSMSGPNNMQYLWVDPKGKKCKCAAPQYVDYVMLTTQQMLNDETVFPTKYGNPFPETFEVTVRKLLLWLYHVMAHMYHAHYKELLQLCLHAHLNTLFLHFSVFCKKHALIDDKETEALEDLYEKLRQPPPPRPPPSNEDSSPDSNSPPEQTLVQEQNMADENKENTLAGGGEGASGAAKQVELASSGSSSGASSTTGVVASAVANGRTPSS